MIQPGTKKKLICFFSSTMKNIQLYIYILYYKKTQVFFNMIWDLEKLVLREITLTETMHNQGFLAYILILLANYLDM